MGGLSAHLPGPVPRAAHGVETGARLERSAGIRVCPAGPRRAAATAGAPRRRARAGRSRHAQNGRCGGRRDHEVVDVAGRQLHGTDLWSSASMRRGIARHHRVAETERAHLPETPHAAARAEQQGVAIASRHLKPRSRQHRVPIARRPKARHGRGTHRCAVPSVVDAMPKLLHADLWRKIYADGPFFLLS